MCKLQKNQDLIFRRNLECKLHTTHPGSGDGSKCSKQCIFVTSLPISCKIYSIGCKGKRRYPHVHFEYKTASEGYLELIWFQDGLLKHSKYQADTFFCVKKSKTCLKLSTTSA